MYFRHVEAAVELHCRRRSALGSELAPGNPDGLIRRPNQRSRSAIQPSNTLRWDEGKLYETTGQLRAFARRAWDPGDGKRDPRQLPHGVRSHQHVPRVVGDLPEHSGNHFRASNRRSARPADAFGRGSRTSRRRCHPERSSSRRPLHQHHPRVRSGVRDAYHARMGRDLPAPAVPPDAWSRSRTSAERRTPVRRLHVNQAESSATASWTPSIPSRRGRERTYEPVSRPRRATGESGAADGEPAVSNPALPELRPGRRPASAAASRAPGRFRRSPAS